MPFSSWSRCSSVTLRMPGESGQPKQFHRRASCSNRVIRDVDAKQSTAAPPGALVGDPAFRAADLLVIASDFPPLAGTNTQRVQSFVRHLPSLGWEPVVVTRDIADLDCIDSSQLSRLRPGLTVIRVKSPDPFRWWARRRGYLRATSRLKTEADRLRRRRSRQSPSQPRRHSPRAADGSHPSPASIWKGRLNTTSMSRTLKCRGQRGRRELPSHSILTGTSGHSSQVARAFRVMSPG